MFPSNKALLQDISNFKPLETSQCTSLISAPHEPIWKPDERQHLQFKQTLKA